MFVDCIPERGGGGFDYAMTVLLRLDGLGRDCVSDLACCDWSWWRDQWIFLPSSHPVTLD